MENNILIKLEKAFVYFFIVLTLFLTIVTVLDLIQFTQDPSDYYKVYHKNPADAKWVKDYIIQDILRICSFIVTFALSLWRLIRPNKVLRLILNTIYLIITVVTLVGLYKWFSIGFDHP
jgi:hypothetical protein